MKTRLLLLAAFAVSTTAVAAPHADLQLVPQARVSDDQVTLGDLVRLQSDDLALVRRLVSLPVGQAPRPGESALVQRGTLADWVRRSTGLANATLRWSGADAARVIRTSRQLRGEEIADAAMEGVRRVIAAAGQHAELRVRSSVRDVEVPDGKVQLLPRPTDSGAPLRNRALVWVDAWVNDRFIRSFPVTVEISDLGGQPGVVPVATGAGAMAQGVTHPDDANAVSRGEWAALRITSGAVSLESRVEVLQDGRVGQRVRVRAATGASGILFAKVIGRGQLELAP
ncbi:MAG: flagella basal body P-ring formation protein FlgA [Ramlibacter sp.]|jgi:flagella basal body P-ring formation protein FlgA|nr:flagella basal body P-ring formation protein FlgA [Ramlibacter sp.]